MNSLWDIRIFLGLVPNESLCIYVVRSQSFEEQVCRKHQMLHDSLMIIM